MRVLWSTKSMEFLYFLSVGRPLCCQVYPGMFAASAWPIDVLYPGWLSSFVMEPRCCLCGLFFPLFSENERHFGIWQVATCLCALISQFLICCCIYRMSACA
jgi:hypothetical protein